MLGFGQVCFCWRRGSPSRTPRQQRRVPRTVVDGYEPGATPAPPSSAADRVRRLRTASVCSRRRRGRVQRSAVRPPPSAPAADGRTTDRRLRGTRAAGIRCRPPRRVRLAAAAATACDEAAAANRRAASTNTPAARARLCPLAARAAARCAALCAGPQLWHSGHRRGNGAAAARTWRAAAVGASPCSTAQRRAEPQDTARSVTPDRLAHHPQHRQHVPPPPPPTTTPPHAHEKHAPRRRWALLAVARSAAPRRR